MASEPVAVWPENQSAFELFARMGTQWRASMAGYSGLDYNVLMVLMGRMTLSGDAFDDLFDAVRVMESEALRVMRE